MPDAPNRRIHRGSRRLGDPCALWAAVHLHHLQGSPASHGGRHPQLSGMGGFIKGLGPKLVSRIIDHFKADTLTVIEENPSRLTEVAGIGAKTARRIVEAWQSHHAARQLIQFLEKNERGYRLRRPICCRSTAPTPSTSLCNDPLSGGGGYPAHRVFHRRCHRAQRRHTGG
jgi:NAD-dependent DNA ligase